MSTNIHLQNIREIAGVNSTSNDYFIDIIGNKMDTASATASTASIVAMLRYIIANYADDADVLALLGAITTTAHTGAVDATTTIMGYLKQLVTDLIVVKGDLDNGGRLDLILDSILADTNTTVADWNNGGRLDLLLDAVKAVTDLIPDAGAMTSIALAADLATVDGKADTISTAVVTTIPTLIGTPVAVDISADIANVYVDTQAIATDTGTTIPALIGTPAADISADILAVQTVVDANQDLLDGTTTQPAAVKREAGRTQVLEVSVTAAANAGLTTLGTATIGSVIVKSVSLYSNGATTADLTSAAIQGGAAQATEFISAASAVKANIDAESEQVNFSGAKYVRTSQTIVVDLQGTGATAVDLIVAIEYIAAVDGAYIA